MLFGLLGKKKKEHYALECPDGHFFKNNWRKIVPIKSEGEE